MEGGCRREEEGGGGGGCVWRTSNLRTEPEFVGREAWRTVVGIDLLFKEGDEVPETAFTSVICQGLQALLLLRRRPSLAN